jgi:membrane-associated protease RseP (regulator of RpoE activity)
MATALFRPEDRPLLHLGLFVATLGSTFATFFLTFGGDRGFYEHLWGSVTFALSVVLILGCHEMGHYVMTRVRGVDSTLPYFIPLPLLGFGTLGAVIRIRGRIPSRNALVDIGAWGPLAGFLAAIPVMCVGFALSTVVDQAPLPAQTFPADGSLLALSPKIVAALRAWWTNEPSPWGTGGQSVLEFGDNLLLLGVQTVFFGRLPAGKTVSAHPMVLAGWFGTLVTMLNLLPIGQLDGGHLTYALWGEKARTVGKLVSFFLLGLALFYSAGWVVWFFVSAKVVGYGHPPVLDTDEPLSRSRRWVCAACLGVLALCVLPVPLRQIVLP